MAKPPAERPPAATVGTQQGASRELLPRLVGTRWYWIGTLSSQRIDNPDDPNRFAIELLEDEKLVADLGCAQGTARWAWRDRDLTIEAFKLNRGSCSAPHSDQGFAEQLTQTRGAIFQNELLQLDLPGERTMVFAREPDWTLRQYTCARGSRLLVALGPQQANVRWMGRTLILARQTSHNGLRYSTGSTTLFSQGHSASLVRHGQQVAGPCQAKSQTQPN